MGHDRIQGREPASKSKMKIEGGGEGQGEGGWCRGLRGLGKRGKRGDGRKCSEGVGAMRRYKRGEKRRNAAITLTLNTHTDKQTREGKSPMTL